MSGELRVKSSGGQDEVQKHQLPFVVYQRDRRVVWTGEWSCNESTLAGGSESGLPLAAPSNLVSALLTLVQAPRCFSEPVTQRKPMKPAFKVRLTLRYSGRLQLPIRLEACSLSEPIVDSILKMHSEGNPMAVLPSLPQQQELEHSSISSCIQTHERQTPMGSPGLHAHVEDLEFTDLRFGKSSRMHRRWVLFSCRLGRDTIYLLYKLPTIVLSRKTDQFEKACSILMKKGMRNTGQGLDLPGARTSDDLGQEAAHDKNGLQIVAHKGLARIECNDGAVPSGEPNSPGPVHRVRKWIHEKYEAAHLTRQLSKHDMMYLEAKACSDCQLTGLGLAQFEKSHQWESFQHWFLMCLRSLKQEEHLWNSQGLMKICDLMVDRAIAEDLLLEQPVGTFIVRLCSEPGAFAISIKVDGPQADFDRIVDHYLVDALDLRRQRLEVWISAHSSAAFFLDVLSGNRVAKTVAFPGAAVAVNGIRRSCQINPARAKAVAASIPFHGQLALSSIPTIPSLPLPLSGCQPTLPTPEASNSRLFEPTNNVGMLQESLAPTKPTTEELLQLAAWSGFDVSQGLGELFQPTSETTMDKMSELAQYCGIDVNELKEPAKVNGITGFLFGVPMEANRTKRGVPGATSIEQLSKKSRLGSY